MMNETLYDFSYLDISGNQVSFEKYRGYVVLVVNTASKCGFTPQFEGLEHLYQKYRNQKFVIIGFPCNQFQGQDPGTNEEIRSFCERNYGVTFPMAAKIDVNGTHTHPIFAYLKANARGILGSKQIKWNFTKFLIDRQGNIVKRYAPYTKPSEISSYIEKLL